MSTSTLAAVATSDTSQRVPPCGHVALLPGWSALEGWQEPRVGRSRREGRRTRLLRVAVTPVTAPGLALDAGTLGLLVAACAHRLRASVRATDHVARVGDHGMAVLLDGADDAGAQTAAERLVRVCQGPYRIGERRLALRVLVDLERPTGADPRR
jgi:predicted signal transduction protein with EAL and GGDEF domain